MKCARIFAKATRHEFAANGNHSRDSSLREEKIPEMVRCSGSRPILAFPSMSRPDGTRGVDLPKRGHCAPAALMGFVLRFRTVFGQLGNGSWVRAVGPRIG